jgi:hypothetical protein
MRQFEVIVELGVRSYEVIISVANSDGTGVPGPQGPQGATGPAGPQGATGPQGPPGLDAEGIFGVAVVPNPSTEVTNTTSLTRIARIEIDPEDWLHFDVAIIKALLNKTTGTGATLETRIYMGNNVDFSLNSHVRTINAASTASTGVHFEASFNRVGENINVSIINTNSQVSELNNTNLITSNVYALNFSQKIYLDWVIAPGILGMTTTLRHFSFIPVAKKI